MNVIKSKKNISLGKDYNLRFGDALLTLDMGAMKIGDSLPADACLVRPDLTKVDFPTGINKRIYTVPSLDTPVCEWQIKNLSQLLDGQAQNDIVYYVVSVDTPFAQNRFIKENKINPNIVFVSDYAQHQFMTQTGLRIIELNVFARAIIDCDKSNIVRNVTIPEDITHIP